MPQKSFKSPKTPKKKNQKIVKPPPGLELMTSETLFLQHPMPSRWSHEGIKKKFKPDKLKPTSNIPTQKVRQKGTSHYVTSTQLFAGEINDFSS